MTESSPFFGLRAVRSGFGRIALAVSLVAGLTVTSSASAQTELPADFGGFVTTEGTKLKLNGGDFYFSGANTYAMVYSREQAEETMKIAKSLGHNAVRMWGFWDGEEPTVDEFGNIMEDAAPGTDRWGRPVLQSRPRVYNELGFRNFDYAIYMAHVYGVKLIIPLLNEWDEFGGLRQYLEWTGHDLPEPIEGRPHQTESEIKAERYRFFECQECRDIYLDYVHQVLNRVNTITGVAYKDDPAIMIWEVMNEPRFGPWLGDPSSTAVRDFLKESAEFIKSIDQNHLVGTGEEGFLDAGETPYNGYPWDGASGEGSSFILNSQIDAIDVMTFHAWPFNWSISNPETFLSNWIEEHARISREIGKPLYLGEFGWQILRREGSDLEDRNELFTIAFEKAIDEDIAGIAYWNLNDGHDPSVAVYDGPIERLGLRAGNYDDESVPHDAEFLFDVFCPEDTSTCGLISGYTQEITSKVQNPDPPFTSTCFSPRTICGDQCVLTDSHPDHCGACGNVCGDGLSCVEGACVERTVSSGWDTPDNLYDTAAGCSVSPASPAGSSGSARLASVLALLGAALWWRRRRQVAA